MKFFETLTEQVKNPNVKKPKMAAYQKYFQGYTEAKVPKKGGCGYKIVRVYTDPYHVHDMSDGKWRAQKLIYVGLTILCAVFYLFAALCKTENNHAQMVALPGGLSAFTLIFALTSVFYYIFCPRKMTAYNCNSSASHLKTWTLASAVSLFCVALTSVVHLLFYAKAQKPLEALCCVSYFLSGAALLIINRIESKTEYCEEYNDTVIPFFPDTDF